MDGLVEENGAPPPLDPLGAQTDNYQVLTATSIVQITVPAQTASAQVQSVIQPTQQSVIQTATNLPMQLSKGNVILVSKPSSVIHTTQGSLQTLQIKPEPTLITSQLQMTEFNSEDNSDFSDDESPKKRRDLLTRRPSYRKILNDLGGVAQGGLVSLGGPVIVEDQTRKRELRLLKNREAARECRRKKKEYIKCLENRVAVLENQNKALIDELKALKELYCQQKTD